MLASSKHKYSETLAFPDTYYELIINLLQSVELFCAYPASAHFIAAIKITFPGLSAPDLFYQIIKMSPRGTHHICERCGESYCY